MRFANVMKGSWMTSLNKCNHYFTMMYGSMQSTQECTPVLSVKHQMGNAVRTHSKIDTGANGNLMPISMFTRLFSHVSLDTLKRTIDRGVTLYAYNNTQIKQYGNCNVKLSFKGRTTIGKFFVVEHETAIIEIHDVEKLGLIRVNFNLVEDEKTKIKIIDEVKESQEFKNQIEQKYPELFKGIGLMKGEINIKLKDGAVPHIEPVRRVPHAMQEPLKNELDKLVKE